MDKGQKTTEARLKEIERRINKEYKQAIDEIEDELTDYLQRFEKKDETWRKWVENGTKTEEEYEKWRIGQMAVGKRWSDQKEMLAHQLYETNERAKNYIKSVCPEVYAENFNFSTYDIEKQAHIDTGFTLYSKESVEQLIEEDPEVLPPVGKKVAQQIAEGKAVRWNKQQLQSVMIQGILQGDSIPKLATRLATKVGDSNRKAAIRNARTMATGAQNAGRVAAYKRAKDRGADIEQMWMATLDNRTRHSHRQMDREIRPVGEPFSNKCEFPADPKGPAAEIYNCRCTLRAIVKGLEPRSGQYRDNSAIDGMSYEEWKNAKAKSQDILMQENKGKAIKGSYISGYKNGTYPNGNGIIGDDNYSKRYSRAKSINTIDDVRRVSDSSVIDMDSYSAIKSHFAETYNVAVEGFEKKDLFAVKATLAGYDDMLREFPEVRQALSTIKYNPYLKKDYGNWSTSGVSEVGKLGLQDYGTGIHEPAHALDHVRSGFTQDYAADVVEQARKNLHYRAKSKAYISDLVRITGGVIELDDPKEVFAYAMETAKGGVDVALANEIYRIVRDGK